MKFLFAIAALLCTSLSWATQKPLIIGLSIGQGAPYVFEQNNINKGLLFDVATYISNQTKIPMRFVYKPPARIRQKFTHGEIDAEIGINPAWRQGETDISIYTLPFVNNINSLILRRGQTINLNKHYTESLRIGLINRWEYPELESIFHSNQATRYDYDNLNLQITNLLRERVDVIVANRLAVQYLAEKNNWSIDVGDSISELPLMIRLHFSKEKYIVPINQAIKEGIQTGAFKSIFEKYGVTYSPVSSIPRSMNE